MLDKLRTLVIPLLLWNALYLLHAAIRQYLSLGYWPTYTPGEWLRYLTIEPANSVFWFVDVLILFTLLYPLILWGLRKKWPVWCAYGIAIGLNLIPAIGIPYASVLFWLPCYLMGAYIGYHYDALFQRTPTLPRKPLYLLAALVFGCIGRVGGAEPFRLLPLLATGSHTGLDFGRCLHPPSGSTVVDQCLLLPVCVASPF